MCLRATAQLAHNLGQPMGMRIAAANAQRSEVSSIGKTRPTASLPATALLPQNNVFANSKTEVFRCMRPDFR